MRLRLTAHLTVILFLGAMAAPLFSSYHNSYVRHIDKNQVQNLESHSRKIKKQFKLLGLLTAKLRIITGSCTLNDPASEITPISYPPMVTATCRAPPV